MNDTNLQPGTKVADKKFYITILADGPYLVYGRPPLSQQFITPDGNGENWTFTEGMSYSTDSEPTALCRCGYSKNKPYCDGSHMHGDWDPRLTAPVEPLLDGAELYEGPEVSLSDNQKYCVFSRFCDARGRVWNIVSHSDQKEHRDNTVHEANMCPGGRLSAWDNASRAPFEPKYDPSLGLIEDKPLGVSGGLWVRGGIPVKTVEGESYEVRNRVVLCRCGQSGNKPFCDGTHASMKFRDGLPDAPRDGAMNSDVSQDGGDGE